MREKKWQHVSLSPSYIVNKFEWAQRKTDFWRVIYRCNGLVSKCDWILNRNHNLFGIKSILASSAPRRSYVHFSLLLLLFLLWLLIRLNNTNEKSIYSPRWCHCKEIVKIKYFIHYILWLRCEAEKLKNHSKLLNACTKWANVTS